MRWKIHAAVILVITVLILGVFALFDTPESQKLTLDGSNPNIRMQIQKANWGNNCNSLYEIYKRRAEQAEKNGDKRPPSPGQTPPVIIPENNAIGIVKGLCEGRSKCRIDANSGVLGNVFSDCSKDLEISWRCFSYDKLRYEKAPNGGTIRIDCENT